MYDASVRPKSSVERRRSVSIILRKSDGIVRTAKTHPRASVEGKITLGCCSLITVERQVFLIPPLWPELFGVFAVQVFPPVHNVHAICYVISTFAQGLVMSGRGRLRWVIWLSCEPCECLRVPKERGEVLSIVPSQPEPIII